MENINYRNKNIEKRYLKNMQKIKLRDKDIK